MTNALVLPAGFEDLATLAAKWSRPTERERDPIRWRASKQEFADFYTAFAPRLDAALKLLQDCTLDAMDEPQLNLFLLTCAFAEASPHHELYGGKADVPHSFSARRFVPNHGDVPSAAIDF